MGPKFELTDVRRIIGATDKGKHVFTSSKAISPVVIAFKLTPDKAKDFILEQLLLLEDCHFSSSIYISPHVFDIYGLRIKKIPFYIKFSVVEDSGNEIIMNLSFHPTTKELKTKSEILEKYESEDI